MLIYKVFRQAEWRALDQHGATAGSPLDLEDGYIHISAAGQAEETVAKHFAGEEDLVLAALDADSLGEALRWEASRGGALFPHLYRELKREEVVWAEPLVLGPEGKHIFPPQFSRNDQSRG